MGFLDELIRLITRLKDCIREASWFLDFFRRPRYRKGSQDDDDELPRLTASVTFNLPSYRYVNVFFLCKFYVQKYGEFKYRLHFRSVNAYFTQTI